MKPLFHSQIPLYFFKYHCPINTSSSSASNSTSSNNKIHSPFSVPQDVIKYPSMIDMISNQFPSLKNSSNNENSDEAARIIISSFHNKIQKPSTCEFFSNCEASHSGITNFTSEQNRALNQHLLLRVFDDYSKQPKLFLRQDIDTVIELGAGTGRVSSLLSQVYANEYKINNNNKGTKRKRFLFLEPDERLRQVCLETAKREFTNKSKEITNSEQFWESIEVDRHDATMLVKEHLTSNQKLHEGKNHQNQNQNTLLILSGVAQYVTDQTLCDLMKLFPRVLLQEDVAMSFHLTEQQQEEMIKNKDNNNNIFSIYHERDGSFVRSEKYFEKIIFNNSHDDHVMEVKSWSIHENDGCVTKTWALMKKKK